MSAPYKDKRVIGSCTLYLGNCMEVVPTLGLVDALVTDPPYGMSFQSGYRKERHRVIANDGDYNALLWACSIEARHSAYVFCRWDNIAAIPKPKSLVAWVKNNWSMGDLNHEHARQYEVAAFFAGPDHDFPNGRPTDVFSYNRSKNEFHPTEKPVDLMREVVSHTRGVVVDPFMGSGTTLVACAKMGRSGIGIELDPDYFEIACKRVQEAYDAPDMFVEPPAAVQPKQEELL